MLQADWLSLLMSVLPPFLAQSRPCHRSYDNVGLMFVKCNVAANAQAHNAAKAKVRGTNGVGDVEDNGVVTLIPVTYVSFVLIFLQNHIE